MNKADMEAKAALAKLEHEERKMSYEMLSETGGWQAMTTKGFGCYVKKRRAVGMPECGIVVEDRPTVVVIFDTKGKAIKEYPFESLDAMLNDGWVVD